MYLSKWYGDCVTPDGRALIAYWARLGLGWLRLPYAAVFETAVGGRGPTAQRVAVRRSPEPVCLNDVLWWSCPPLGFDARWGIGAPPPPVSLFQSEAGAIRWQCLAPRAAVRIERPGGSLTGCGYLERLVVTLPLSKLPMDQLRWGRFISPEVSLVWIAWRGAVPRTWVFRDGAAAPDARVTDGGVALADGGELTVRNEAVIRDGPLGPSALSPLRVLRAVTPRRLWWARETKWLARGSFISGAERRDGWVIHEVVRWA